MRFRGQAGWALLLLAVVVVGGVYLQRVGPKASAAVSSEAAPSGAWFCPHGGGAEWAVTLELANPGTTPVQVRVGGVPLIALGNGTIVRASDGKILFTHPAMGTAAVRGR